MGVMGVHAADKDMGKELRGLNAVVTGASRGIGRDTALALARAGANVAINAATSLEEAGEVAGAVRALGVDSFPVRCDVADPDAVTAMFDAVVGRWGAIDIVVNNAGIVGNAPAEAMTAAQWRRMIDVNLGGVFFCAQAAGRAMIISGRGGSIVNVTSICAHIGVGTTQHPGQRHKPWLHQHRARRANARPASGLGGEDADGSPGSTARNSRCRRLPCRPAGKLRDRQ